MTDRSRSLTPGHAVHYDHPGPGGPSVVEQIMGALGDSAVVNWIDDGPPPPPPPPTGTGPSGILIPPPPAGWRLERGSDFDTYIPLGQWQKDPDGVFQARPDPPRDGTYKDSSGRAIYDAKRTISQHDGLLDCMLFQSSSGQRYTGSPIQQLAPQKQIRVTECSKVEGPQPGWKMAHLLSVTGGNVSTRGEDDMPEGKFTANAHGNGFHHYVGGGQDSFAFPWQRYLYEWHAWTIEYEAGDHVSFYIDGKLLVRQGTVKLVTPAAGLVTTRTKISKEPMNWKLQNETYLKKDPIPAQMGTAHVLTDWALIEVAA